jgi:hypothetical protein
MKSFLKNEHASVVLSKYSKHDTTAPKGMEMSEKVSQIFIICIIFIGIATWIWIFEICYKLKCHSNKS